METGSHEAKRGAAVDARRRRKIAEENSNLATQHYFELIDELERYLKSCGISDFDLSTPSLALKTLRKLRAANDPRGIFTVSPAG